MEFGLFTTDSALLQCLFFFMTFSAVYAVLVCIYEDAIIRQDHHIFTLIAYAWSSTTGFLGSLTAVIIYFPKALKYWNSSDEGRADRKEFLLELLAAIIILCGLATLVWVFFGMNFLLVDAGAGHFCKKW